MLSMNSRISIPWSRKLSAMLRALKATRARTPGGSFIWPKTRAVLSRTPASSHIVPQVVAFAAALSHATENRIAAMLVGDIADQLVDDHRLADACAAKDAHLAAAGKGRDQVQRLEARLKDLDLGGLLAKLAVESDGWAAFSRFRWDPGRRSALPGRSSRAQNGLSYRHRDRLCPGPRPAGPAAMPSVGPMAMQRTAWFGSCCCTSTIKSLWPGIDDLYGVIDRRELVDRKLDIDNRSE